MALDLNALVITDSEWTPNHAGRRPTVERGPNPFLLNGWLKDSYDTGKAKMVTVEGHFEEVVKKDRKGVEVTRVYVRGDAEEVIKLLREAGNELKIGVAVKPVAGKRRNTITIHYLGQKRKQSRKGAENA